VEKHKTIQERVVIKKKPEPVWRELAIPPESPRPSGMEQLGELLRAKLEGRA
jgi:hypothetical protein